MAHVLQVLTEADPTGTVLSIDGISAYDLISRRAMLEALRSAWWRPSPSLRAVVL